MIKEVHGYSLYKLKMIHGPLRSLNRSMVAVGYG